MLTASFRLQTGAIAWVIGLGFAACKLSEGAAVLHESTGAGSTCASETEPLCLPSTAEHLLAINAELATLPDGSSADGDAAAAQVADQLGSASFSLNGILTALAQNAFVRKLAWEFIHHRQDVVKMGYKINGVSGRVLLRKSPKNSAHPLSYGLASEGRGVRPVFLKPFPSDFDQALRSFNLGDVEARLMAIFRGLRLAGIRYVQTDLIELETPMPTYTRSEQAMTTKAMLSAHAQQDGKTLLSLDQVIKSDNVAWHGGLLGPAIKDAVSLWDPVARTTVNYPISKEQQERFLAAIQSDSIMRVLVGDIDGAARQFLVEVEIRGGGAELTLLPFDYGMTAGFLADHDFIDRRDFHARSQLLSANTKIIDLGNLVILGVPMPATLSGDFKQALANLRVQLRDFLLDPSGANTDREARFQAYIDGQYQLLAARFGALPAPTVAAAAAKSSAENADEPADTADDSADRGVEAGASSGSEGVRGNSGANGAHSR